MTDARLLDVERWIAWVRLGAVFFAAVEVGVFTESFPPGYERVAWALTAVFALGRFCSSSRAGPVATCRRSSARSPLASTPP